MMVSAEKFAAATCPSLATSRAPRWPRTMRRRPTSRRSRSMSAASAPTSPGSRARRPPSLPRWSNARSVQTPPSRRENANCMRSAIPWCTPTASRRCHRCPGSGMTLRPSNPSSRRTFRSRAMPAGRRLDTVYAPARKNKALALGPGGTFFFPIALETVEETVRRALESCGGIAGVPCMIVALNDSFVVPIPATLKVTGFFKAAGNTMISADAREDVARRMADAQSGWNAVAVGTAGRPGLGLKAATEAGRGQRRACRLRQARQQLPGYCDWSVFGRTELDRNLPAPGFDPSGAGELAEGRRPADLRPIANSMNKFR